MRWPAARVRMSRATWTKRIESATTTRRCACCERTTVRCDAIGALRARAGLSMAYLCGVGRRSIVDLGGVARCGGGQARARGTSKSQVPEGGVGSQSIIRALHSDL